MIPPQFDKVGDNMDIKEIEKYKETVLNLRIPEEISKAIEELAHDNNTSKSEVARFLLKSALKEINKL